MQCTVGSGTGSECLFEERHRDSSLATTASATCGGELAPDVGEERGSFAHKVLCASHERLGVCSRAQGGGHAAEDTSAASAHAAHVDAGARRPILHALTALLLPAKDDSLRSLVYHVQHARCGCSTLRLWRHAWCVPSRCHGYACRGRPSSMSACWEICWRQGHQVSPRKSSTGKSYQQFTSAGQCTFSGRVDHAGFRPNDIPISKQVTK